MTAEVDDADNLNVAFEGVCGAFCITFFWEHFSPEKETAQVASERLFADNNVPVSCLRTSFYWDNFSTFGTGPKPNPDGSLAITLPMDE